jgi:alanine racemase
VLRIDLAAVAANYRILSRAAAPARIAAVVKADGYGLGATPVAQALAREGCRDFFVAVLGEAVTLRPALPEAADLFVLNGLLPGAEEDCAAIGAVPVLNSLDQIDRWSRLAGRLGVRLRAALQVDTGMSRMGLAPDELEVLKTTPSLIKAIEPVLLMSHLACADEPDHDANATQLTRFRDIARDFPGVALALDNSGGIFLRRGHFDLVRAGIAMYGGAPHGGDNPMTPVISLEARIAQVRTVPPGAGVGYGMSFRAHRATRIATIPVGYADGLPRTLGNRGNAFIAGLRVPIVGRVSMDSITLDVTTVAERHLVAGSRVELIGPHQSLDDLARDAGTISYEILTQLGRRYAREYAPLDLGAQETNATVGRSTAE